jgi:hypothetical protein
MMNLPEPYPANKIILKHGGGLIQAMKLEEEKE